MTLGPVIAEARQGAGGTLLVFGSMTMWNGLLTAGLVDELHIMVGAGVLIDGVAAFSRPAAKRHAADQCPTARRVQHRPAHLLAALTALLHTRPAPRNRAARDVPSRRRSRLLAARVVPAIIDTGIRASAGWRWSLGVVHHWFAGLVATVSLFLRLWSDLLEHRQFVEMPVDWGRGPDMGTPRSGG